MDSVVQPEVQTATLPQVVNLPVMRIEPTHGWVSLRLGELWERRELIYFFVWRDLKVRYKQTALGAAWAILQPFTTMVIFSVLFARLARVPSDGLPYPIFALTGLLPWNYFAGALSRVTMSVVGEAHLVSKIYFPRLIIPLSGVLSGLVDFFLAFVVLVSMMFWYGLTPARGVLALPILLLYAMATVLAVGLWLSVLYARYRDVGQIIPFLIQCWMYVSPVAYPTSLIPEKWRFLYSLNPMVGVIEGFRWGLLDKEHPAFGVMAISGVVVTLLLIGGVVFFRHMEASFPDMI
jgi:homopolymeric O-antigen transport system permease protein